MKRVQVRGHISSAGFADGHRFVVGHWPVSPIGPLCDVMWGTPEGERILLVPTQEAAEFVGSIYSFDDVRVGRLDATCDGRVTTVSGHGIELRLEGGRRFPIPIPRPLAITRFVEGPIARALMGVETFGVSPLGATEWYQTRGWRWVTSGSAHLDGVDLGDPGPLSTPMGVGFSEPPPRPSIVSVHVTIDLPAPVPTARSAQPRTS